MKTWLLLTLCAFAVLLAPASFSVTYATIDYPGARQTFANSINNAGDIVGMYELSDLTYHGFILSNGIFTTMDAPTAQSTFPFAVNDLGQTVGYYINSSEHGFMFSGGVYTDIDFPGAQYTYPAGLNNAAQVVGYYTDSLGAHGFEFDNGIWTTVDLPHATATYITGINNHGDLFGTYYGAAIYGFLQSGGVLHVLQPPGNQHIAFTGTLNDYRQGVGYIQSSSRGALSPFLFQQPNNYTLLRNLSTGQIPGMFASGINNNQGIVGYYTDSQYLNHGFLAVN